MSTTVRHYIFPDKGAPQHLSHRLAEGLIFGKDTMPQYAGTRQRALSVYLDNENGEPLAIINYQGTIWSFDETGAISAGIQESLADFMSAWSSEDRIRPRGGTVIPLGPELKRRQLAAKYRWQPTQADLAAVAADIWPKDKADRLKVATGTAPRKPKITYDAEHALQEASKPFWEIGHAIDQLKEPSLVGFIYLAKKRGTDPDYPALYAALAEMAEHRLEIRKRRRRDKGTWFAYVEILLWNDDRSMAETTSMFHVECKSRGAAVLAARGLLSKHADKFGENVTVEANIVTDLEWEDMARASMPERDKTNPAE